MKLRENEMKEYISPLLVEIEEACNLRKVVALLYHNYIVLERTLTEPHYFTFKRKCLSGVKASYFTWIPFARISQNKYTDRNIHQEK